MADSEVLNRIEALLEEERALRSGGDRADPDRIQELETTLDQCWDLLRQRRALREFGDDESAAAVRGADTVEGYEQ